MGVGVSYSASCTAWSNSGMSPRSANVVKQSSPHPCSPGTRIGWARGLRPERAGCEKNLGNVGLRSGQPEGPLLSGASCGGKEACSRFVVYVLVYTNRIRGENTRGKDE